MRMPARTSGLRAIILAATAVVKFSLRPLPGSKPAPTQTHGQRLYPGHPTRAANPMSGAAWMTRQSRLGGRRRGARHYRPGNRHQSRGLMDSITSNTEKPCE